MWCLHQNSKQWTWAISGCEVKILKINYLRRFNRVSIVCPRATKERPIEAGWALRKGGSMRPKSLTTMSPLVIRLKKCLSVETEKGDSTAV